MLLALLTAGLLVHSVCPSGEGNLHLLEDEVSAALKLCFVHGPSEKSAPSRHKRDNGSHDSNARIDRPEGASNMDGEYEHVRRNTTMETQLNVLNDTGPFRGAEEESSGGNAQLVNDVPAPAGRQRVKRLDPLVSKIGDDECLSQCVFANMQVVDARGIPREAELWTAVQSAVTSQQSRAALRDQLRACFQELESGRAGVVASRMRTRGITQEAELWTAVQSAVTSQQFRAALCDQLRACFQELESGRAGVVACRMRTRGITREAELWTAVQLAVTSQQFRAALRDQLRACFQELESGRAGVVACRMRTRGITREAELWTAVQSAVTSQQSRATLRDQLRACFQELESGRAGVVAGRMRTRGITREAELWTAVQSAVTSQQSRAALRDQLRACFQELESGRAGVVAGRMRTRGITREAELWTAVQSAVTSQQSRAALRDQLRACFQELESGRAGVVAGRMRTRGITQEAELCTTVQSAVTSQQTRAALRNQLRACFQELESEAEDDGCSYSNKLERCLTLRLADRRNSAVDAKP